MFISLVTLVNYYVNLALLMGEVSCVEEIYAEMILEFITRVFFGVIVLGVVCSIVGFDFPVSTSSPCGCGS